MAKKIGFVDYYISEWHANHYPEWIAQANEVLGTDYEVAYDIKTSPWFAPEGKFDKAQYEYVLKASAGVTPAQFEEQLRRDKLANRFRQTLYSFYKLTPEEIKYAYQVQHGNLKDFEANKQDFSSSLMETKMETAQKAFFDDFNNTTEINTFLE